MTATELYRLLEEKDCEALPACPKELSRSIKTLSTRFSTLKASFGWRGKEKVLRIELVENCVGSVGEDGISANATNATNAHFEDKSRPNTPLANATNARLQAKDDGRERFSL